MQIHRRNGANPAKMSEVRRVYILPQGHAWTIWSTNIDALFIHICTVNFKISHRLLTFVHSPMLLLHPHALSQLFFTHIWAVAVKEGHR